MKTNELKPCPFCGGEARVCVDEHIDSHTYYSVECDDESYECAGAMMDEMAYGTKEEAIKAWNTRK